MYHLRSFQLRDMTSCGSALRRLGIGATTIEEVANRLVRHLYTSLTMAQTGEPACVLARLFKTTPCALLTPDLQALADQRLGETSGTPSPTCLTLPASAGALPRWNDPALSRRFRVISLGKPEGLERLPMFSQLFHRLGVNLTQPKQSLLIDPHEHTFNVFHVPEAAGSPYVPAQEVFVRKYGVRSVLGFGAPLPEEIDRHAKDLSEQRATPIQGFEALTRQARQGGCDEREWTYRRKDAGLLTILVTIKALRNNAGVLTGFLAIGKDITQRKEAEAALTQAAQELERRNAELAQARDTALQAAQIKADFLATMSHEIRTPMNAIIGMTGLLLDTAPTEEQHECADTVRRSSDVLLTIVNDLLDFSKIEAGTLHLEHLAFDLRMAVKDTIELLAEQAQSKGLELIALVDAAVPTGVLGDLGRLRQILVNLVSNAVTFTSSGEIFVQVTRDAQGGPNLLRFTITDTGIGISEEARATLFQTFVQADSSTTGRFGGTGLGLAICQRLVRQMQDRIGVESQPGQGSTFWFTVQLPEATFATPPSVILWAPLRGKRILLVDPNKTVRQVLQQELAAKGMDCIGARNGREAVDLAHTAAAIQKPFDLALLGLHLSDMDGFEMATLLKQNPVTAAMRLVILATIGRRGDGSTAQMLGIDACLTKPLRQPQLLECLNRLLNANTGATAPDSASAIAPSLITRHTLAESQAAVTPRLLLAEDNPVNQKVACKMLEKLGYRVDVASNGQEAVAAHERAPYPLIFMDCQMPEVDGFEATALIRKMEGRSAHTPIVAMTANAMQGDRERCLAAGMDDYVAKPVRPKDLQTVLDTWLGNNATRTGTTG